MTTTTHPSSAIAEFAGYVDGQIRNRMLEAMRKRKRLREQKSQIDLALWFTPEGRVERVEVLRSSGKADLDQLYVDAARSFDLSGVPQIASVPQPRRLRPGSRERSADGYSLN